MLRPILALLMLGLAATATATLTGCPARTNCDKMKRQMDKCSAQLWTRLEPRLRGQNPGRFGLAKNAQHYQYCKRHKGRYKQSADINRCLRHTDCTKFARCFCRAVKKKKGSCR